MSLPFIRHRELIETVTYDRFFERRACPGAGFGFPCDAAGNLLPPSCPEAAESRRAVFAGEIDCIDRGVQKYVSRYWEPGAVRCGCGATIVLEDGMTNQCGRCGQYVNGSGQLLSDPRGWEPEDRYAIFGPQNAPADY